MRIVSQQSARATSARLVGALLLCIASVTVHAQSLLAPWKSDATLSQQYAEKHAELTAYQKSFLAQMLGHLIVTFDAEKVRWQMPALELRLRKKFRSLPGYDVTFPYSVLKQDAKAVVIATTQPMSHKPIKLQLNFEGQGVMWLGEPDADPAVSDQRPRKYFRRIH